MTKLGDAITHAAVLDLEFTGEASKAKEVVAERVRGPRNQYAAVEGVDDLLQRQRDQDAADNRANFREELARSLLIEFQKEE